FAWLEAFKETPGVVTLGERATIYRAGSNRAPFNVKVERQSTYYIREKRQKLDRNGDVEYKYFIVHGSTPPEDGPSKPLSAEEIEALRLVFDFNNTDHDAACVRRSITLSPSAYARCFCERK